MVTRLSCCVLCLVFVAAVFTTHEIAPSYSAPQSKQSILRQLTARMIRLPDTPRKIGTSYSSASHLLADSSAWRDWRQQHERLPINAQPDSTDSDFQILPGFQFEGQSYVYKEVVARFLSSGRVADLFVDTTCVVGTEQVRALLRMLEQQLFPASGIVAHQKNRARAGRIPTVIFTQLNGGSSNQFTSLLHPFMPIIYVDSKLLQSRGTGTVARVLSGEMAKLCLRLGLRNPGSLTDTQRYFAETGRSVFVVDLPSQAEGMPSAAFGSRFTFTANAVLTGVQLATWGPMLKKQNLLYTVFKNSAPTVLDRNFFKAAKYFHQTSQTEGLVWNTIDFEPPWVNVQAGDEVRVVFWFVPDSPSDTLHAVLDTAAVSTTNSFVLVHENREIRQVGFENGNNWFIKPLASVVADSSLPVLSLGILHDVGTPDSIDVRIRQNRSLSSVYLEGDCEFENTITPLSFVANRDSADIDAFLSSPIALPDSGVLALKATASRPFTAAITTDSLLVTVKRITAAAGGVLSSFEDDFSLHLPRAALSSDIHFSLLVSAQADFPGDAPVGFEQVGPVYQVGPEDLEFDKLGEIALSYGNRPDALVAENRLAIAYFDQGVWVVLGGELYRGNRVLKTQINRTGCYRLVCQASVSQLQEIAIPQRVFLQQNYPNPFNPETRIRFGLPQAGEITLRIVNLRGQIIATLVEDFMVAGEHVVRWDGTDDHNVRVASGVYLYQLKTDAVVEIRKLILVK